MLDFTDCSPKQSVVRGPGQQLKPYNTHCRSYHLMVVCKFTPDVFGAINQFKLLKFYRDICGLSERGMYGIEK
jgi:hypothetical protein